MNYGKLFAVAMIFMSFAASLGYLAHGNYRMAAYWFFAACIATTVTI